MTTAMRSEVSESNVEKERSNLWFCCKRNKTNDKLNKLNNILTKLNDKLNKLNTNHPMF